MSGLTGSETKYISSHTIAEHEAAIGNAKTKAAMLLALGVTQDEVDALTGAASASGTNVLVTADDIDEFVTQDDLTAINAKLPTTDQKAALVGTSGTPSASNPYATKATTSANATAIAAETTRAEAAEAFKAPLDSPALTGMPTVPTADAGTNTMQAASTAFVQAELDDLIPFSPILSATGDGSGVAALTVTLSAPTLVRLDGAGYFYTDSAGTTGATQRKRLNAGSNTLYIKVGKSSAVLTFLQGQRLAQINTWAPSSNAPSMAFSLSDLPSGVTFVVIYGSNTISGSLADLPSGVTRVSITGSNTISGSLADLPSGVTLVVIGGSNTVSGSLSDLPSGVTYVSITGSNTCTYNTASGSRTWSSGMREVYDRPVTGVMTSDMIDALLIDLAAQATWANEKTINIKGTRTSASDAAVTTLTGYGVAVTVN